MPRVARFLGGGVCYYLNSKGDQDRIVFKKEEDYRRCLKLIEKYKSRYQMSLYGYCLLPGEIHMIVHPLDPRMIAGFMQCIKQSYAIYFNLQYCRRGKVWGQRFSSRVIRDENKLTEEIKVMEFLPVLASKVDDPVRYEWSSCSYRVMGYDSLVDDVPPCLLNSET